jgi:hypothetical protein
MVRQELNKGKPFEAMSLRTEKTWYSPKSKQIMITFLAHEHFIKIVEEDFTHTYGFNGEHKLDEFMSILTYEKAQALNPPIEVTPKVLKAMEKVPEAKFSLIEKPFAGRAGTLPIYWEKQEKRWFAINGNFAIVVGDYIQADDCPLALQVLLGFTTEGVPKDD